MKACHNFLLDIQSTVHTYHNILTICLKVCDNIFAKHIWSTCIKAFYCYIHFICITGYMVVECMYNFWSYIESSAVMLDHWTSYSVDTMLLKNTCIWLYLQCRILNVANNWMDWQIEKKVKCVINVCKMITKINIIISRCL